MKTKNQFARFALVASMILLSVLGVYIADRTYQYEIIVKGILGCVVLYLLFFFLRYSKFDVSIDTMLADSKLYKHLMYALIGPGIAYWAMGGIFDMISLFISLLNAL